MSVPNVSISPVHVWIVYPKTGRVLLHLLEVHDLNHGTIRPRWQKSDTSSFWKRNESQIQHLEGWVHLSYTWFSLNPILISILSFCLLWTFCLVHFLIDTIHSHSHFKNWWGFWIVEGFRIFKLDLINQSLKMSLLQALK